MAKLFTFYKNYDHDKLDEYEEMLRNELSSDFRSKTLRMLELEESTINLFDYIDN